MRPNVTQRKTIESPTATIRIEIELDDLAGHLQIIEVWQARHLLAKVGVVECIPEAFQRRIELILPVGR
eukprot:3831028-Rhodomonas_salina.1